MKYDELVSRLRFASKAAKMANAPTWADLMREAADAIEELQSEVDKSTQRDKEAREFMFGIYGGAE